MTHLQEIKICGLSTKPAIDAVIAGEATHMGLIFFEKSPRHVSLEIAQELSMHAGNRIKKVAVTVNADNAYLDQIVEAVEPDMLQLHGSESPARVQEIKGRYGLPVIKAFAIRDQADLEKAKEYREIADQFLFDAKPPKGSDLPGGNGVAFDWEIMDGWDVNMPYMLSGGLNLENITRAITRSGATSIDVSSGVESAPGIKDTDLIAAFLKKCRNFDTKRT